MNLLLSPKDTSAVKGTVLKKSFLRLEMKLMIGILSVVMMYDSFEKRQCSFTPRKSR